MDLKNDIGISLASSALDDIPAPAQNAADIVALVKDSGYVAGYKLSDGRIVNKEEGIQLAKNGGINGVGIAHRKDTEYLKSLPDHSDGNNLSNLPSISAADVFH